MSPLPCPNQDVYDGLAASIPFLVGLARKFVKAIEKALETCNAKAAPLQQQP